MQKEQKAIFVINQNPLRPLKLSKFPLYEGDNVIGSNSKCDIHLDQKQIKPQHCIINIENFEITIKVTDIHANVFKPSTLDRSKKTKLKTLQAYEFPLEIDHWIEKYKCNIVAYDQQYQQSDQLKQINSKIQQQKEKQEDIPETLILEEEEQQQENEENGDIPQTLLIDQEEDEDEQQENKQQQQEQNNDIEATLLIDQDEDEDNGQMEEEVEQNGQNQEQYEATLLVEEQEEEEQQNRNGDQQLEPTLLIDVDDEEEQQQQEEEEEGDKQQFQPRIVQPTVINPQNNNLKTPSFSNTPNQFKFGGKQLNPKKPQQLIEDELKKSLVIQEKDIPETIIDQDDNDIQATAIDQDIPATVIDQDIGATVIDQDIPATVIDQEQDEEDKQEDIPATVLDQEDDTQQQQKQIQQQQEQKKGYQVKKKGNQVGGASLGDSKQQHNSMLAQLDLLKKKQIAQQQEQKNQEQIKQSEAEQEQNQRKKMIEEKRKNRQKTLKQKFQNSTTMDDIFDGEEEGGSKSNSMGFHNNAFQENQQLLLQQQKGNNQAQKLFNHSILQQIQKNNFENKNNGSRGSSDNKLEEELQQQQNQKLQKSTSNQQLSNSSMLGSVNSNNNRLTRNPTAISKNSSKTLLHKSNSIDQEQDEEEEQKREEKLQDNEDEEESEEEIPRQRKSLRKSRVTNNAKNTLSSINSKQQESGKKLAMASGFQGIAKKMKPGTLQRNNNSGDFDINEEETIRIAFSGYQPTSQELKKLQFYGAKVMESKEDHFDVLIVNESKRTVKVLVALLKNIPIVSQKWVQDCISKKQIIKDYKTYIPETSLKFKERFGTDIKSCLQEREKIGDYEIFSDYRFFINPNLQESITMKELEYLIETGGGKIFKKQPTKQQAKDKKLICILGKQDKKLYQTLIKHKLIISDPEIVLIAALMSELQVADFIIDDEYFE